jgi:RNA polymerase sigma-70 factor (ECF subfamily)
MTRDADAEFLRALYEQHGGAVYAFVRRHVDDSQRAEDIVQETLLRAWRHLDALEGRSGGPRAYLLTVARNVLTDQWRAEQVRPTTVSDDAAVEGAAASDEDAVDRILDRLLVGEALAGLSETHRQVVEEMYLHGRSVAETAALLGVPEGTVKSRTYYAVRALRDAFEEMGVVR